MTLDLHQIICIVIKENTVLQKIPPTQQCAKNIERGDRYNSLCQSHIPNILSFLPIEAEKYIIIE